MTCENCDGKSQFLKQQIFYNLEQRGLDPSLFIKADPRTRFELIRRYFHLNQGFEKVGQEVNSSEVPNNLGLVIIKPEVVHAEEEIQSYLVGHLGVNIVSQKRFTYSPEEYWTLHGKALEEYHDLFPHGSLLFLLSITAPSELILFEHLDPEKYRELYLNGKTIKNPQSVVDPQALFTEYVIRGCEHSIREAVCHSVVEEFGLISMEQDTCPAVCWDFTGDFNRRTSDQNIRTFNGIHSPRDRGELLMDLSVLKRLL